MIYNFPLCWHYQKVIAIVYYLQIVTHSNQNVKVQLSFNKIAVENRNDECT